MKVSVTAPDQDYKRYLEDTEVLLTTQKQTFTYEFTMGEEDDANGRLEFNLGAAGSKEGVRKSAPYPWKPIPCPPLRPLKVTGHPPFLQNYSQRC